MADDQRPLSEHFAHKSHHRFAGVDWHPGKTGVPLFPGVLALMECRVQRKIALGDHDVFVGEVMRVEIHERLPLLYFASGYHHL